jgi:hypothetical protein
MKSLTNKIRKISIIKKINRLRRQINTRAIQPFYSQLYIDYNADYRNSIFLAGTGRSGTSWVSDIINYKREYRYIFEPFYIYGVDICREFKYIQYLRPDNQDTYFIEAAKEILYGTIRNKWADQYHRRFISNKRLIKDIRANLLLKWIHTNFPEIPINLLLRHPCAVAKSQLRGKSWPADLEVFLTQEALMEDFLNPFKRELETAQTDFEKHIVRWCIQNYVPLKQFVSGEIHVAFYENFCEEPEQEIDKLFSFLGKEYDEAVFAKLRKASPVTREDSAVISGGSLIDSWRQKITDEQTRRAVEILSLFGLDEIYSQDSMPNVDGVHDVVKKVSVLNAWT